eukprot:365272-Chlamydomonas_euryale.AAC.4
MYSLPAYDPRHLTSASDHACACHCRWTQGVVAPSLQPAVIPTYDQCYPAHLSVGPGKRARIVVDGEQPEVVVPCKHAQHGCLQALHG